MLGMFLQIAFIAPAFLGPRPLECPSEQGVRIVRADGSVNEVGRVSLDLVAGCSFFGPDGRLATIPIAEVLQIELGGESSSELPAALVSLHDGSRVLGTIVGGDEDTLTIDLCSSLEVRFCVDAIAALFLGPEAAFGESRLYAREPDKDVVYRRSESGGDFTTGTLISFGADGFRFQYVSGTGKFAYTEVEALTLSLQTDLPVPSATMVEADLWPDGVLKGVFESFSDQGLKLRPLLSEESVEIPRAMLRGLRFPGEHHRWLSDLTPSGVEEIPYLGERDHFLFPWRRDRSVTGRPLSIAGRRFAKGLGCHSRCLLSYDLSKVGASSFRAEVGISDEVLRLPHPGSVEFAVIVDGQEVFRSARMRAGDPARVVGPIPLNDKRSIQLLTDFGADEDIADRALWVNPVLLR